MNPLDREKYVSKQPGVTSNEASELRREIQSLRDRLASLSEASLRITEDLDLDAVLQEVVDGARLLTGARLWRDH